MDRARQLLQLRPKQLLRILNRRWQARGAEPAETQPALTPLEAASRAVETAYLQAQSRHTPLPVTCPVLIIRASQARTHFLRAGRLLGWGAVLRGPIAVQDIDANHETICYEPAVADVSRAIREAMAKSDSAPSADSQDWFLSRAS